VADCWYSSLYLYFYSLLELSFLERLTLEKNVLSVNSVERIFQCLKGLKELNMLPHRFNFCVLIIRKVCIGFSKELHNKFLMVMMTDSNPMNSKRH